MLPYRIYLSGGGICGMAHVGALMELSKRIPLQLVKELAIYEKAPNEVEVTIAEMTEWGFGLDKQFDFKALSVRSSASLG